MLGPGLLGFYQLLLVHESIGRSCLARSSRTASTKASSEAPCIALNVKEYTDPLTVHPLTKYFPKQLDN